MYKGLAIAILLITSCKSVNKTEYVVVEECREFKDALCKPIIDKLCWYDTVYLGT